jgi:hypothetical protein
VSDRIDILHVAGLGHGAPDGRGPRRPFLSIWFRCCHVYGRLYRNPERTMYRGRCPACGATVRATIGPDGTPRRLFEAR